MAEQVSSLKTGIKYKDTPIGKVPVDWKVGAFSELAEINPRRNLRNLTIYPFVEMAAITSQSHRVQYTKLREFKGGGSKFQNGDTLFARITPCTENGKTAYVDFLDENQFGHGSTEFIILGPKKGVDDKFIYYVAKWDKVRNIAVSKMEGTSGRQRVPSKVFFEDIFVPIPPFPEQKKIAEMLSTVDEAIEKTDEIIEKGKDAKKGLMQNLLTRGVGHKKFKKTEIGEIPEEWEVFKLGDVCDVIGGSTPSTTKKEYWGGDISFATPTDITKLKSREISDTQQKITLEGLSSCGTNLLPVGAILLTSRATIGACAINTKPMATNQGFASLVCNEKTYNWFVFYKMMSLQSELQRLGSGSTFKEISKKSVRSLIFSLPPLPEQKQIAAILSSVDDEIEKESSHREQLEALKKGLMQVLLTGKIRVFS